MDFVRGVAIQSRRRRGEFHRTIRTNALLHELHPTPFPLNDNEARADEPRRSFKPSKSATASWKTPNLG